MKKLTQNGHQRHWNRLACIVRASPVHPPCIPVRATVHPLGIRGDARWRGRCTHTSWNKYQMNLVGGCGPTHPQKKSDATAYRQVCPVGGSARHRQVETHPWAAHLWPRGWRVGSV